ncbi:wax ester/triacylglycerol synthase domain-containing protein [Nonomuraea rosea]
MHVGLALRMPGSPPPPAELRELVAKKVATQAPVLACRLVGKGRRARWEPDPAFDPAYHVEYHRVPRGSDVRQAAVEAMRVRGLPRERPLWSLMVLHGHADDEHLLCYRAHHAFQDGIGVISAFRALLGDHELPSPETTPAWSGSTNRGTGGGAGVGGALADLLRLAGPPPRWFSPATGGPGRHLHVVGLDIEPFHDIARATGASVAQIGVSLIAGALRSWGSGRSGQPQPGPAAARSVAGGGPGGGVAGGRDVVVALPVALLGLGRHTGLGNHAGLIPVTLPCGEPGAIARLQRVAAQTTLRRLGDARRKARALYRVPARLTVPLLRMLSPLASLGEARQLNVSAIHLARFGHGAREMFVLPPLAPGVAGMIVVLHAGEAVSFSGIFDARVSRPDELMGLLRPALTELHAAATR